MAWFNRASAKSGSNSAARGSFANVWAATEGMVLTVGQKEFGVVIPNVALNAVANGVAIRFTDANLLDAPPPAVDVICAADICYEKPLAEAVMAWLAKARAQSAR